MSIAISPNSFITIAIFPDCIGENVTEQSRLPAAERTGDKCDWGAEHFKNDEVESRMTKECRIEVVGRLLSRRHGVSFRIRPIEFVIRISSFTSSFHISNRRESRDRLADPCQLSRCDYFIDIFVSATCFLGETCP